VARQRLLGEVDDKVDVAPALAAAAKTRSSRQRHGQGRLVPPLCTHIEQIRPRYRMSTSSWLKEVKVQ
jgi:hypothetical protein